MVKIVLLKNQIMITAPNKKQYRECEMMDGHLAINISVLTVMEKIRGENPLAENQWVLNQWVLKIQIFTINGVQKWESSINTIHSKRVS